MAEVDTIFRQLAPPEEETGYSAIVDSVVWQKKKAIDLWDRPVPRDVYSCRHARGENYGYFMEGRLAAVVSLVSGAPSYWKDEVPDPAAVWFCTLATTDGHHGRGAGRAAVDAALAYVRRRGEPAVWLDCRPGFLEQFYSPFGFNRIREKNVETCRSDLPCRCVDAVLMRRDLWPDVTIRDAVHGDVPSMAAIRGREALHRERISAADGVTFRCLVAETGGTVAGFGYLVLKQPPTWPEMLHLPRIIDLNVAEPRRGQGLGSRLIREIEGLARAAGYSDIGLAVDAARSPRALALYRRLRYIALNETPVEDRWEFTDSSGVRHERRAMLTYMRKAL